MPKPCFVYVFAKDHGSFGSGPVKIGISSDPEKRLRGLQTSSPFKLTIMCKVYTHDRAMAQALEAAMHAELAEHRMVGEWFNTSPFQALETLLICYRELCEAVGLTDEQFYEYAHAGSGIAECLKVYTEIKSLARSRGVTL